MILLLDTIIDSDYLYQLIDKTDDLLIIDSRPFIDYINGHIPGAINLDLMNFHWHDSSKDGVTQFNKQMKILLNNIGIDSQKFIIFYDDISGSSASRGIWMSNYFSFGNTYMLNGGFKNWVNKQLPIEKKTNPFIKTEREFTINDQVLADVDYLKKNVEKNATDIVILDCRSEMEYSGLIVRASRGGHIPHAVNIDWIYNLENEKFKRYDVLDKLYSFISKKTEVVTYCQGGYRAANTYLVLKNLGYYNVKMYLGSWGEWGNISTLPIE